ncbi:MAG: hypothetical protein ABEJ28_04570 [Salinigranum sp.]
MGLYDRVADLSLVVSESHRTRRERDTSSGFTRLSTTFELAGLGVTGRGEDVTYDAEDHEALGTAPALVDAGGLPSGEYTVEGFSEALDDVDLFPTKDPEREASYHYRRWAVESAGLDLALRQAETNLGEALGREYRPVRFVTSARLGGEDEEPSADRVETLLARVPDLEFKLDPTSAWSADLIETLAATDAVRILDLKGHYEGTSVDQDPDVDLYERILTGFPEAVIEDPAVTEATRPLLVEAVDRLSWDAPIAGVDDLDSLPFEPRWLNVKPSRFGTVRSLFETLEEADRRGISLYGGGQFELGVGRRHVQLLASLFYPDGPNDVAPGEYNDPEPPENPPSSPLPAPTDVRGLGGE